jgi:hypothetical protein
MSVGSSLRKGLKFFLMSLGVSSQDKSSPGKSGPKSSSPDKKPRPANEPVTKRDSSK